MRTAKRLGAFFKNRLHFFIFGIFMALFFYLHTFVFLGADDFYYGTFWADGLDGFIKENIDHYRHLTGRTFVHLLSQTVTYLGMTTFALVNTVFIGLMVYFSTRISTEGLHKSYRKHSLVIVILLFASTNLMIMRESVLWISGAYNYLFPCLLQLALFDLLYKDMQKDRPNFYLLPLSFLAAATVEQLGILAVFTNIYLLLVYGLQNKKRPKRLYFLHLSLSLLGYLSLFLSPGVNKRLSYHEAFSQLPILEKIKLNLEPVTAMIIGQDGLGILIAALILLAGLYLYKVGRNRILLLFSIASSVLLILSASGLIVESVLIMFIGGISSLVLVWIATGLFLERKYPSSYFILIGLATLGVMLLSPVLGMRMTFGARVFFTIALCRLINLFIESPKLPSDLRKKAFIGLCFSILLIYSVFNMIGLIRGYQSNALVLEKNLIATLDARDSGAKTLQLEAMIDEFYGYENIPVNGNFTNSFIRLYDLSDSIEITLHDPSEKALFYMGKALSAKAIERNSTVYLPIRAFFEAIDYDVAWENGRAYARGKDGIFAFKAGQSTYRIKSHGEPSFRTVPLKNRVRNINSSVYIPIELLEFFPRLSYDASDKDLFIESVLED